MTSSTPDANVLYVTFPTTYWALRCEKEFLARALTARLCPVPRRLSSSCGFALEVRGLGPSEVTQILDNAGIDNEGVWK